MPLLSERDPDRLTAWLTDHVAGFRGPFSADKLAGGQSNPTFLLVAASGRYVLRRQPFGPLLPSAHALDREFRVLAALHGSAVPVARPLALCRDRDVIGAEFYLMAFVDGRCLRDPALPTVPTTARAAYFDALIDTLAALHRLDVDALGLADFGRAGDYFARQLARWTQQYRAAETRSIAAMEQLIVALPGAVPADDGSRMLVHGDYRIDNLLFAHDAARVVAVVDWELATLGHPLADLGYLCMALRLPRNPVVPGLAGLDRAAHGIPSEQALIERYCAATGRGGIDRWNAVLAFSFFRLAAIAQGVARRAEQGNASSEQAVQAGQMVTLLAEQGAALLD